MRNGFVRVIEAGFSEPHGLGQQAKYFRVGFAFSQRSDRGIVGHHVVVAVRFHHVEMLELSGGGQQDIRIVRRVGLEMFQHDGEQVLAREPPHHARGIGRDGDGIRVVDDEGPDRRGRVQQRMPDGRHVDGSRPASG